MPPQRRIASPLRDRQALLSALLGAAKAELPLLLEQLETLVRIESPSSNKEACDRALAVAAEWAAGLGARVRFHRSRTHADSLEARFPAARARERGAAAGKPLLLLGHVDTVWPEGTLARMPFRVTRDRVSGPGVLDMKAGVAMAFAALRTLRAAGAPARAVTLLLHGDEEVGSPASRAVTERVARACAAVYVPEPAQGGAGAYKTARKGVGQYRLDVRGVAAHSGVDFAAGHSAVLELAAQLPRLAALTGSAPGLTVNPGGDWRWNTFECGGGGSLGRDRCAGRTGCGCAAFRAQAAGVKGGGSAVHTCCFRRDEPAADGTDAGETGALFEQAREAAAVLGFALEEAATGGGSDGNFTAALGIPTLDGMGAVGAGAHASHEHLVRSHLAPRVALLAAMCMA